MKKILLIILLFAGISARAQDPNLDEKQRVVNLWVDAAKGVIQAAPQSDETKKVSEILSNQIVIASIFPDCGMTPNSKDKIRIVVPTKNSQCFMERNIPFAGQKVFYNGTGRIIFLDGEPNFQNEARFGIDLCKAIYLSELQKASGNYFDCFTQKVKGFEGLLLQNLKLAAN